ncbi:50S ribosomal protein L21 [Candidatus Gottesmanbacteria bacterium RBG_16_52_11]|uniref:Large ribosomal subunit protein bL21 n=1 Tax=Candidatus Gottesmanbacteria bacterium RBG_16_52_11 TaxID=1798374 RepID=A0A1F5YU75_9BACT|nr:MAG: 50S ribosomal protein L21 [Candidatus Gottesmanbacteria bacterium RBG_16_52_11]
MFAVVRISGKQYKVAPKDTIEVARIQGEVGGTVDLPDVLMLMDNGKVTVGTPVVKGMSVKAKILEQGKGDKIDIRRYKNKVRYRRHRGFRSTTTKLSILSIGRA